MPRLFPFSTGILAAALAGSAAFAQQTVPFQLQDNLVRIPVQLNGHAVDAVLDSGTGALAVDYDWAQSLSLDLGASIGMVPGGGQPEPMYPLVIDSLSFGPVHLTYFPAIALNLSHLSASAGFPVRVLLGRPIFAEHPLRIDYLHRQLEFLPADVPVSCPDPLPLTFVGGDPVVAVTVQAAPQSAPQTLHLILDLGTRHYAAMLGSPFLDTPQGAALEKTAHPRQVGTGTGGIVMGASATLASLTLGSHQFSNLTVALTRHVGAFAHGGADGSLGVPLWQGGAITFDYPHKLACLDLPN